jgi:tetratricopeptide (TPR) repeat protein
MYFAAPTRGAPALDDGSVSRMRQFIPILIGLFAFSPASIVLASNDGDPPSVREQAVCKVDGQVPDDWYVFAQDDAKHWKDMECPRPATLEDPHFNAWRIAPATDELLVSCRDTSPPKGYRILEKLFRTECPSAGMNLLGEPNANAYKLVRQTETSAPKDIASRPDVLPGPKNDSVQAAQDHAVLGNQYFAGRRYREAETEFREAGTLDPVSADWPSLVALTLLLRNKYDEAKTQAEVATRLDPKNAMAHAALAAALSGLSQWKDAEVEARVSLHLDPASGRGLPGLSQYLLGLSLWHNGKKEEGEETLREIVATHNRYRGKFAQLLLADGKLDEAEAQFREALKQNPGDLFLTTGLDEVLKAKGSQ